MLSCGRIGAYEARRGQRGRLLDLSTWAPATRTLHDLSALVSVHQSGPAPSSSRRRERLALAIAIFIAIGGLAGIYLWARSGFRPSPHAFYLGPIPYLVLVITLVTQGVSGLILTVRRPANLVSWLILTFAGALMLGVLTNGYLSLASSGWSGPVEPAWAALVFSVTYLGGGVLASIALGHVFPDGHLIAPVWRFGIVAAVVGYGVFAIGIALTPGPLTLFPTYVNPVHPALGSELPALARVVVGPALLVIGSISTAAALVQRYRTADEIGRLQVRGYAASGVLLVAGFVAYVAAILTLPPTSVLGEWIVTLFYLSAAVPPFFLVFAILRYRLYEIDHIIGRAVVYGSLTAILAGIYAASVRLFNAIFVQVTGETSELALVLTTLILATTFTPIKGRLERIVAERMKPATAGATVPGSNDAVAAAAPDFSVDPVAARADAMAAILADPVFAAALDARVKAIVERAKPPSEGLPPD